MTHAPLPRTGRAAAAGGATSRRGDVAHAGRGLATDDAPGPAGEVARLRAVIAAYVGGRRDAGVGLDRVLPEVRDLVRDAEVAEGWPDELGVLQGQVVRWTVEAYVDEPRLRDVPRFY